MEPSVTDDLHHRLRAARPPEAQPDEHAFDAELLARVRRQPIASRRAVSRAVAVPLVAAVTLAATAAVMLGGGPGDVGGPSSASAITQALRWLNPPPGTILHVRSIQTQDERTTTRELWQSADDPESGRQLTTGASTVETSGDAFYDPATDTIYDPPAASSDRAKTAGAVRKKALTHAAHDGKRATTTTPAGDPIVAKARILLQEGRMTVTGREVHNGTEAWAISLKPDAGRPVWTLWVSAADGKPLEVRDPGRDANEQPQRIRWEVYEVLPASEADRLLTLTGAHPSARIERDPAKIATAEARLIPFEW